jgi:hypothetical protein
MSNKTILMFPGNLRIFFILGKFYIWNDNITNEHYRFIRLKGNFFLKLCSCGTTKVNHLLLALPLVALIVYHHRSLKNFKYQSSTPCSTDGEESEGNYLKPHRWRSKTIMLSGSAGT